MIKIVGITIVIAALAGVGFYIWYGNRQSQVEPEVRDITLSVWSLQENPDTLKAAMDEYTKAHPNVKFSYKYQPLTNYRSRVATQIGSSEGPDIFMIHNSWLPLFSKNSLVAGLPADVMSGDEYSSIFYPVLKASFANNGSIYGISQGIDGIGLYYNIDMLREVGATVPKDWREFETLALKLVKKDDKGNIIRSGAAIGSVDNIKYWSDVLGLLFKQQPGADLSRPQEGNGPEVLSFYTGFATPGPRQVWDTVTENSVDAFINGKVAMIFAPSGVINEIRTRNSKLKFGVANVPQRPGKITEDVYWGSFWGWAVSKNSIGKTEAWDFLKFMTSKQMEIRLFNDSLQFAKVVVQPYSRIDLQTELANDTKLGAFVRQGGQYQYWYLNWGTEDKDLNEKIISLYAAATRKVLNGVDPKLALGGVAEGVAEVLAEYPPNSP